MEDKLKKILSKAKKEIKNISSFEDLEKIRNKFLGRQKELSQILRGIKDLPKKEKPKIGKLGNEVRQKIERSIREKEKELNEEESPEVDIDLTIPGEKIEHGHLHPLTQFMRKVIDIFQRMGFEVVEGSEVESAKYNFDLLNIPKNHPARDMWDTYYVEPGQSILAKRQLARSKKSNKQEAISDLLLRTHTSPMQIRSMQKRKPPVRLIVPGRVFRHEATDASHETTFYQCEGLVIDQEVKVTDLIGTVQLFLKTLFGKKVKTRVRPHYYPFTEPSMDFDMSCLLCEGEGCRVCGQTGWLEMMGSGLVHPKVLKNMNVDPEKYTGFAFGMGIDRFMMLYYGIDDIRLSYQGDLRFLKQF
ncbi:MAG: phenylalanine--tRNA ligase subunit alpha [Patescibacteria group bacterium]|nr:phenylalanine--tRNA ligase subunit alpha [Patescibacteria group bacterium]